MPGTPVGGALLAAVGLPAVGLLAVVAVVAVVEV